MSRTAKGAVAGAPECMTCKKIKYNLSMASPESWGGDWVYQPKYDGVRCLFSPSTRMFTSRQKSKLDLKGSRVLELTRLILPKKYPSLILDGELYIHGKPFEEILSIVKRENHPDKRLLQYVVFDCIVPSVPAMPFHERNAIVRELAGPLRDINVFPAPYFELKNCVHDTAQKMTEIGYEGVIMRRSLGRYVSGPSSDMLKFKLFDDAEFAILSAEEGNGKNRGTLVFTMRTKKSGATFTATSPGSYDDKRAAFKKWKAHIEEHGKGTPWNLAKVKFQGASEKGIPRFPVIIALLQDRDVI